MSSEISFEKCPICGQEGALYEEYEYRTQETYKFCSKCGYWVEIAVEKDDDGNAILPLKHKKTEIIGAGVIRVSLNNEPGIRSIPIIQGETKKDVEDQVEHIIKNHDVKEIHATWFDNYTKTLVEIL